VQALEAGASAPDAERLAQLFDSVVATRRPCIAAVESPLSIRRVRLVQAVYRSLAASRQGPLAYWPPSIDHHGRIAPPEDWGPPDRVAVPWVWWAIACRVAWSDTPLAAVHAALAQLVRVLPRAGVPAGAEAPLASPLAASLERIARAGAPLIVVLDEAQWADAATVELIRHVLTLDDVAILAIATSLPESIVLHLRSASGPYFDVLQELERADPRRVVRITMARHTEPHRVEARPPGDPAAAPGDLAAAAVVRRSPRRSGSATGG
jgi:hypothetical protein